MAPLAPPSASLKEFRHVGDIEYFRSMQKLLQHIYVIPLFLSMLLSLKTFRLKWPAPYRYFSILLIVIFVTETLAISWKYFFHNTELLGNYSNSNLWLYNIFLLPQYCLYLYIYFLVLKSRRQKYVIKILGLVYPVFVITNILLIQHIHSVSSYSLILSSAIILFLTICYFEQLRNQNEIINLSSHPMSWLSLGAFIFHAANLPYIICLGYLVKHNVSLAIALYYIYLFLNCLLYTLYCIAFLCRTPHQKY